MDVRYLYSVNPKKPIRTIKGVPVLRTPKSLQLTKEDVRECLKYGSVYRRFANENRIERVTVNSVDRFHNAKFMTEEEYEAFLKANIDSKTGTVINTQVVVEESVKEESVVEEIPVKEETPVEETVEEAVEESDVIEDEVFDDTVSEDIVEEVEEAEEVSVEEPKKQYDNHKNYSGKKHRR